MTAVDLDALDAARDRLTTTLRACGLRSRSAEVAAWLMPDVQALVAEGAAAELRAAADAMVWPNSQNCGPELRARADALDPT